MGLNFPNLIDALTEDLTNEWQHLQYYLYHSSAVKGPHAAEYREFFADAAKSEMGHVQQFLDKMFGLRHPNPYRPVTKPFIPQTAVNDILQGAIDLETTVIQNYTQRLADLEAYDGDPTIAAYFKVFYEAQLQDSYEDREKMQRMLASAT